MKYHELLTKYIDESGLSLGEIVIRAKHIGVEITKSYISKLKNGNKPPASEDITRALAKVTKGDAEALLMARYVDKAPSEIRPILKKNASDKADALTGFGENQKFRDSNSEIILDKETQETLKMILISADKWGLSPSDPKFKEIFLKVMETIALARGEDSE
ncbi:hypothetical protein [Paenibacillus sp. IHBB 3054]|uniref:hypothetical protein n=1 Tax=Paenibacillus sp. IHBB 3054 TaxID=3425689 RepID=UPI003F6809D5